jgi:LAO/AO transport system ATPase
LLTEQIITGSVRAAARLMRAIDDHEAFVQEELNRLKPYTGRAHKIGITGAPGVGKSTLTDGLIQFYRKAGQKVGIICVDPTSPLSGGAILGDRLRMQRHAADTGVFIRSVATRGHPGGVSRSARDIAAVMDAMGYDVILMETVGSGQDEVAIFELVHTGLVVLVPSLGDGLQAVKAGVMEMGDIYVVNKADLKGADVAVREIESMLALDSVFRENWTPPVVKTAAVHEQGIFRLSRLISRHKAFLDQGGKKPGRPQGSPVTLHRMDETARMRLGELMIGIKSAGEIATAVACRLYAARIRNILMLENAKPMAVRRAVAFSEAVRTGSKKVEGIPAVWVKNSSEIREAWQKKQIAVAVDPAWSLLEKIRPHVVIDGILAKQNLGTTMDEAPLVIGLGPGFTAETDVHAVIETNRGHHLGRVILKGCAEPNTGKPGEIGGYCRRRLLRAPGDGVFKAHRKLGASVVCGEIIGYVGKDPVRAEIDGVLRGLIASETEVGKGCKLGDIDPRKMTSYVHSISDKGRAVGGGVLEVIVARFNR